jgi:hypothetical protein
LSPMAAGVHGWSDRPGGRSTRVVVGHGSADSVDHAANEIKGDHYQHRREVPAAGL